MIGGDRQGGDAEHKLTFERQAEASFKAPDDMVERVARAICTSVPDMPCCGGCDHMVDLARRAIAAMREAEDLETCRRMTDSALAYLRARFPKA